MVTRADLSTAMQGIQIAHAASEWPLQHPELAKEWHENSNSLVCVTVADEEALYDFIEKATSQGIIVHEFREPDLAWELTAVAVSPSPATRKLCAQLPLAFKHTPESEAQARKRERRVRAAVQRMENCEQTKGLNVLEHGVAVRNRFADLVNMLNGNELSFEWRLPSWFEEHAEFLKAALPSRYVWEKYLVLHDIGKPNVMTVDEEGRRRFPNHAAASANEWRGLVCPKWAASCSENWAGLAAETFGPLVPESAEQIAWLIEHDMDVHTMKAADIETFVQSPLAPTLLLSALAEVHANADMFGGITSDSFKAKWKQIDRRGKAALKQILENQTVERKVA